MAAAMVFGVGVWMGDGTVGGRNERRRGRGFRGKMYIFEICG
jgi:hypothetical protein